MTKRQKEIIANNLRAFEHNFGKARIEDADYGGGFYVFSPADSDSYVQYCHNIDYLDGWLYGCVQAVNKIVKPILDLDKTEHVVKVVLANGDYWHTKVNGTKEEIEKYYVGAIFNVGVATDNMQKCIRVEFE